MDDQLRQRIQRIRLVFMDVDGVLTDGGLYYGNSGERMKKFYVKDGTGIRLLSLAGYEVVFITGLESALVRHRAEDLKLNTVIQGCTDKASAAETLLKERGLDWKEAAFIGDDIIDLGLLRKVGLAVAVADAVEPVKAVAHYITALPGGRGAVRELCDLILATREAE